jgi:hypothetical protein
MFLLVLAMTLTNAQQARHDADEWKMYQQMQSDESTIADIWRPDAKLISDDRKLRKCYVQFHLYQATDCNAELMQLDHDLGEEVVARTKDR